MQMIRIQAIGLAGIVSRAPAAAYRIGDLVGRTNWTQFAARDVDARGHGADGDDAVKLAGSAISALRSSRLVYAST